VAITSDDLGFWIEVGQRCLGGSDLSHTQQQAGIIDPFGAGTGLPARRIFGQRGQQITRTVSLERITEDFLFFRRERQIRRIQHRRIIKAPLQDIIGNEAGGADRRLTRPGDGLRLRGAYVAAAVRCAPPANAPTPEERDRCAPFLRRELALLVDARVIVALGAFGWVAALRAVEATYGRLARPLPRFGHAAEAAVGPYTIFGTFHPSQQNTFTGRLTAVMLDAVLARAVQVASIE
jgi:uracil-DNA glycosylase family 4